MATITERLTAVEAQLAAVRTTLDELVLASREMSMAIVIGNARRLNGPPAPKKRPRPDYLRLVRLARPPLEHRGGRISRMFQEMFRGNGRSKERGTFSSRTAGRSQGPLRGLADFTPRGLR